MKRAPAVILMLLSGASCSDETVQQLRVRFPDCSINPELIGTLVYILEPADGGDIEGLEAGTETVDGIEVSGDDVDADGRLEAVFRVRRANHPIRDGFAVRLVADRLDDTELAVQVLAGDDQGHQIGALAGEPVTFHFVKDEVHTLELPIVCLCLGMQGCGGTCEGIGEDPDCRPAGDHEAFCHDGLDNDADPLRDCADPECYRRGPCEDCHAEVCDNGEDDDCDSDIDCGDDACEEQLLCIDIEPEDCDNGGDDDRDHLRDCLDPDCADDRACTRTCTPSPEVCDNRRDDDCDHRIDCVDDECAQPAAELACDDGFDDDCDDRVDCEDPDCYSECGCDPHPAGTALERAVLPDGCHDGLDNDCDGTFDCEDADCVGGAIEDCDDTVDNDCDGNNNCADDDCPTDTATELCDDLFDNDCDGIFDCEDPACHGVGTEQVCSDFLDNDCDEKFDCDDADCAKSRACTGSTQ